MTWDQIEANWKQLKGVVQETEELSSETADETRDPSRGFAAARANVETEFVSYKRSVLRGTAFIRRRNPAQVEQAGWTADR